jgi:hypothetical protein
MSISYGLNQLGKGIVVINVIIGVQADWCDTYSIAKLYHVTPGQNVALSNCVNCQENYTE